MKIRILKLLLLFIAAIITHGCSTPSRPQSAAADEKRVRAMTGDRSTWVDAISNF